MKFNEFFLLQKWSIYTLKWIYNTPGLPTGPINLLASRNHVALKIGIQVKLVASELEL